MSYARVYLHWVLDIDLQLKSVSANDLHVLASPKWPPCYTVSFGCWMCRHAVIQSVKDCLCMWVHSHVCAMGKTVMVAHRKRLWGNNSLLSSCFHSSPLIRDTVPERMRERGFYIKSWHAGPWGREMKDESQDEIEPFFPFPFFTSFLFLLSLLWIFFFSVVPLQQEGKCWLLNLGRMNHISVLKLHGNRTNIYVSFLRQISALNSVWLNFGQRRDTRSSARHTALQKHRVSRYLKHIFQF